MADPSAADSSQQVCLQILNSLGVFLGPLQIPSVGRLAPLRPFILLGTHSPHQVNSHRCLANDIAESLAESAAAYTKATARKCLLEKVEVITGEEAESNVLQVRWREGGPLGPHMEV